MDGLSGTYAPHDAGGLHSPEAQLAAALMANTSALITGPDGTSGALLQAVAMRLASSRTRVLRVGPPLDLPGFLNQAARAGGAAGGTALEQGFAALTDPGPSCDRIALLVEDAHLMPDATLRYIEFAMHAGPHLCVALAGQPGIADTLGLPGYAGLRRRLPLQLALLPAQPAASVAVPRTAPAEALPANAAPVRRRGIRAWREMAGVALAAGVAVLLWTRTGPPPADGAPASVQAQPAGAMLAAPPPSPQSGAVQPAANLTSAGPTSAGPTSAGSVAAEEAEPTPPVMKRAAAGPTAAEPDPAPSGTLAGLPSAPQPDPAAPGDPGEAAGPATAVATIEPPAVTEASRSPATAPDLQPPGLADAPAAVPPAAPGQEGPTLAGVADLQPVPSASASMPPPAAPHVARPSAAPDQDSPMPAATAGLPAMPPAPAFVPPLPAPAAPQVAGTPAAPDQDDPLPAAVAGLQPEPSAPAPVPPSPAPALKAAPQAAGPPAVPDQGNPVPAVAAGLLPASPVLAPSQPAAGLAAPLAGSRRTVPALQDPSAVQTPGRTPTLRRPPPRAAAARNEQAATRPAAPGPDLGYCRGIVMRAQLGEDLTYGDRIFMRNGCR